MLYPVLAAHYAHFVYQLAAHPTFRAFRSVYRSAFRKKIYLSVLYVHHQPAQKLDYEVKQTITGTALVALPRRPLRSRTF